MPTTPGASRPSSPSSAAPTAGRRRGRLHPFRSRGREPVLPSAPRPLRTRQPHRHQQQTLRTLGRGLRRPRRRRRDDRRLVHHAEVISMKETATDSKTATSAASPRPTEPTTHKINNHAKGQLSTAPPSGQISAAVDTKPDLVHPPPGARHRIQRGPTAHNSIVGPGVNLRILQIRRSEHTPDPVRSPSQWRCWIRPTGRHCKVDCESLRATISVEWRIACSARLIDRATMSPSS